MFITYGTTKIKHKVVWFLADINTFTERKLFIFEIYCNKKTKYVTVLTEKDKLTGEIYSQKSSGKNAEKIIDHEQLRKLYTSEDIKIKKGKPYGWTYGENIEIHNKNGEVVSIKQKRCDYFGQKETINTVDVTV